MRVNGIDLLPFTAMQRAILMAVARRAPDLVRMAELIEQLYPNPFTQPESAWACIHVQTGRIRKKWTDPDWRLMGRKGPGGGYYLERTHAGH